MLGILAIKMKTVFGIFDTFSDMRDLFFSHNIEHT